MAVRVAMAGRSNVRDQKSARVMDSGRGSQKMRTERL